MSHFPLFQFIVLVHNVPERGTDNSPIILVYMSDFLHSDDYIANVGLRWKASPVPINLPIPAGHL